MKTPLSSIRIHILNNWQMLYILEREFKNHLSEADSGPWHHARLFDYICDQTLNLMKKIQI